jgi:hypothetical protein
VDTARAYPRFRLTETTCSFRCQEAARPHGAYLEAEAGPAACRDGELIDVTGNPDPSPLDAPGLQVTPVVVVETDEEGRWWIALQPGRWCFGAIDPIDGSRQAVAQELGANVRMPIDWVFDHGAY